MATAHNVHVRPAESGILAIKQDEETAAKVSDLLQKDLEVTESPKWIILAAVSYKLQC
jgi:hypothetical protein